MDNDGAQGRYPTISHRVAAGYLKFLASYPLADQDDRSKRDLHGFFAALYEALYRQPDLFGLPLDTWRERR